MLYHKNYGRILQLRDCHTAVVRKFGSTSLGIPDIDNLPFSSLSKSGITKTMPGYYSLGTAIPPYKAQGLPYRRCWEIWQYRPWNSRYRQSAFFQSFQKWNHKTYARLLQLRDCDTAVVRKFGSTSLGIPDNDFLPFSSLSKSGITKPESYNYCSGSAKLSLIEFYCCTTFESLDINNQSNFNFSKCAITKTMAVYYNGGTAIPPQIRSLVVPPLEFQICTLEV